MVLIVGEVSSILRAFSFVGLSSKALLDEIFDSGLAGNNLVNSFALFRQSCAYIPELFVFKADLF